jgi:hypothetical protein
VRTIPCLALILLFVSVEAFAQPDFKKICGNLANVKHQHPYLLFTSQEKAEMLKRIKSDRRSSEVLEKIIAEGKRYLLATAQPEPPARTIHTRYIGADPYTNYMSGQMEAAFTLAFVYQMTGDVAYAAKAFEYADRVCALESWVQGAHMFDVIYSRVWPYNVNDDRVVFTYDITASRISQDLSYVYDWISPVLSKRQRDRIRGALLEKAITRVRGNYEYFWWSTASKCNWSGICYTGLGLTALTLLNEDPQLTDVVARSCEGVWNMLDHVGEDGGWQEGRGYWAYGLGESVRFMDAIKRATAGEINMFKHKGVYPNPADFALFGLTAGFGDGSGFPVGAPAVMNKLTQETGSGTAAWYVQNFLRPSETIFDLIWPAPAVQPQKPTEASRFFKSIDWAVFRKDFAPEYMTVACKAGMNDDPHHGHLDCGTFSLSWHNLNYIGEIPRLRYDERYFDEMRWEYTEASSKGHNVVVVNGEEQISAKLKDQPWKSNIGGKIIQYLSEPAWAYTKLDPTHAYPGKELKLWIRWIILDKENNVVVLLDKIGCAKGSEIEIRFHSGVETDVMSDHVVLRGRRPETQIRARAGASRTRTNFALPGGVGPDMEMIPLCDGEFTVVEGRQVSMPITEEDQFSWIPYFSTVLKAGSCENFVATVFCPEKLKSKENAASQFKLDTRSGIPEVSCSLQGSKITYIFSDDRVIRRSESAPQ